MSPSQKQRSNEVVFALMLGGTVTVREFAVRGRYKQTLAQSDFSKLKSLGVIEDSRLVRRQGGRPVVLTAKAMASVMEHAKRDVKRTDAIDRMLEEYSNA